MLNFPVCSAFCLFGWCVNFQAPYMHNQNLEVCKMVFESIYFWPNLFSILVNLSIDKIEITTDLNEKKKKISTVILNFFQVKIVSFGYFINCCFVQRIFLPTGKTCIWGCWFWLLQCEGEKRVGHNGLWTVSDHWL